MSYFTEVHRDFEMKTRNDTYRSDRIDTKNRIDTNTMDQKDDDIPKESTTFFLEIDDCESYQDTTEPEPYNTESLFYECPICQSYNCNKHHLPQVDGEKVQFLNNNNILDTLKELEFNNNLNSSYLQSNYKKWLINLSPMH